MSFGDAVRSVLSKYVCFSGRARRSEYWYFILFEMIVSTALSGVASFIGMRESSVEALSSLLSLALLLPGLGVTWRRLHDVGKSGANYFWVFLPLVGWIPLLIWLCRDGDRGPNRFGPDPKYPDDGYAQGGNPWEY